MKKTLVFGFLLVAFFMAGLGGRAPLAHATAQDTNNSNVVGGGSGVNDANTTTTYTDPFGSAATSQQGSGSGATGTGVQSAAFGTGGFVPLAPIPGLTSDIGSVINANTLSTFFSNLYKYCVGLAATLAVIQIIWAGLRIASNQDNVSAITDSKGHIANAIFGLILVLSPVLVFSIINPNILNLSLNLPSISLPSGAPAAPAPSTTVPSGATVVPFGAALPAGKWCYNATPRTQSYGQTAPFCFDDEAACLGALANAKASANGTVDLRTVCFATKTNTTTVPPAAGQTIQTPANIPDPTRMCDDGNGNSFPC